MYCAIRVSSDLNTSRIYTTHSITCINKRVWAFYCYSSRTPAESTTAIRGHETSVRVTCRIHIFQGKKKLAIILRPKAHFQ